MTLDRVLAPQRAEHVAPGVHLELGQPRGAAQVALVALLDAGLADRVTQPVAAPLPLLQLRVGDLTHVPEDVGGQRVVRVGPLGQGKGVDAGEVRPVLLDVDERVLAHPEGDRHRLVRRVLRVVDTPVQLLRAHAEEGGQAGQGALGAGSELGTADGDRQGDPVVDQGPAPPVEDAAPGRFLVDDADPVLVGPHLEGGRVHHLQVPEAGEQRGEERRDDHADHCQAQSGRLRRGGAHRCPATGSLIGRMPSRRRRGAAAPTGRGRRWAGPAPRSSRPPGRRSRPGGE